MIRDSGLLFLGATLYIFQVVCVQKQRLVSLLYLATIWSALLRC